ncbi:ankyrin repeat-containing domain protein [Schizothecium vesticola]|uniref:Ankyrin repeat-containing domain protein n=1 Tax=Schizothecium vesticola TaxID=314040 RepID=A0AA40EET6_9PEZI|nr:ankyrin repeat-containing domain protein [Schizothecium vesticola]
MAPSRWQVMAPELVDMVVKCLLEDISHNNLCALVSFIMACRLFYLVGLPTLYKAAARRHPYLLAWAAETNNMAVLRHLLDAGQDPDTVFWPPHRIEGYWLTWGQRCCQTYGPQYDLPIWPVPHEDEKHEPAYIFRRFYMIPDSPLQRAMAETANPKFKSFCTDAAERGGHPFLGFATLRGSHPQPMRKDSPQEILNYNQRRWRCRDGMGFLWTPLHLAICQGQLKSVKFLLSQGAQYLSETRHQLPYQTALHQAATISPAQTGIVDYLVTVPRFQALLTAGNSHGVTPLWNAYLGGREDNMRLLLQHGADIDATVCPTGRRTSRSNTFTMLYHACAEGRLDMARVLLDLGASATPAFPARAVLLDTGVLRTNGHPGPFPMRALDMLVAALSESNRCGDDAIAVSRASNVINALVTASGGLTAAPKVDPGEAPAAQDPLLIATRGYNFPLLDVLLRHPSFKLGAYELDEGDVDEATKHGTALYMRLRQEGRIPAYPTSAGGTETVAQLWRDAIREHEEARIG